MLKPVRKQSLSDAVYEQLRDEIISGGLEAGAPLPSERVLCETLGVNRGALREALKRLEQARLVSVQHGGPTRVLNFRETSNLDLLAQLLFTAEGGVNVPVARSVVEMRSALAPDIARLAALRGGPAIAARLDELVTRMADAGDNIPELQVLSLEFWDCLVEGSGNIAYRLAFNSLRRVYSSFQDVMVHVLAEEMTDHGSYADIAQAVRNSDTLTAENVARTLIHRGAAGIGEVLTALGEWDTGGPP